MKLRGICKTAAPLSEDGVGIDVFLECSFWVLARIYVTAVSRDALIIGIHHSVRLHDLLGLRTPKLPTGFGSLLLRRKAHNRF